MTFADFAGLALIAFCGYELYCAVKKQETVIPNSSFRASRAEQPVIFWVATVAWAIFLLVGLMLVGDIL
jgi:choline-glycine betaine transporter